MSFGYYDEGKFTLTSDKFSEYKCSFHERGSGNNGFLNNTTDENSLSYPNLISTKKDSITDNNKVETSPLIPEWANQTDNPAFFQNLDIPTFLRKLGSNRPRQ